MLWYLIQIEEFTEFRPVVLTSHVKYIVVFITNGKLDTLQFVFQAGKDVENAKRWALRTTGKPDHVLYDISYYVLSPMLLWALQQSKLVFQVFHPFNFRQLNADSSYFTSQLHTWFSFFSLANNFVDTTDYGLLEHINQNKA